MESWLRQAACELHGEEGPWAQDSGRRGIPLGPQAFRSLISGEEALEVGRRLIFLDENGSLTIAVHPSLMEMNLRSFMRCVKNIIVSGVDLFGELIRGKVTPEVIRATRCHMKCSENLFVLNVTPTKGKELCAESELAKFPDDRVAL